MSGPDAIVGVVVFTGIFATLRPLAGAIARRIGGGAPARSALGAADRDAILGELEQLRREHAELAERMDFAERMLAKQREEQRLPKGEMR